MTPAGRPPRDGPEERPSEKPLWAGRFAAGPAPEAWRLVRSLGFDVRLAPYDVRVSKAHAAALRAMGLVEAEELRRIEEALDQIAGEIAEGRFPFAERDEDVHMAIERALTERLGETGAKLHAGRSRNDQVVADLRLFVVDVCAEVEGGIRRLVGALVDRADEQREQVMPGYTHLQRAQPVSLANHLLAHAWPLVRDAERVSRVRAATDRSPLGAGALAGSTLPVPADRIAADLGFTRTFENPIDAVSDRDFALDFLAAGAILGVHLSRLAEDIVLWSTAEFGFVEVDEAYATGSSMMPQKRNPDAAELARAKAGRLLGNLVSLATVLKGLPLAYARDLQEDKEPVFDTADTLAAALGALAGTVETLRFRPQRLTEAASDPALLATDVAEHLVARGMPFRAAHALVGRIVAEAEAAGRTLADLSPEGWKGYSELLGDLPELRAEVAVARRESAGHSGGQSVERQLAALRAWLGAPGGGG